VAPWTRGRQDQYLVVMGGRASGRGSGGGVFGLDFIFDTIAAMRFELAGALGDETRVIEATGELDESEAEEGDMAETGEASSVGGVSAHPVFTLEKETDDGARDDASHHGPPTGANGECRDLLHCK
jgi:hypothetical protein